MYGMSNTIKNKKIKDIKLFLFAVILFFIGKGLYKLISIPWVGGHLPLNTIFFYQIIALIVFFFALFLFRIKIKGLFLFKRNNIKEIKFYYLYVFFFIISIIILFLYNIKNSDLWININSINIIIMTTIFAPLYEEILFRGLLQKFFEKNTNKYIAILISSIIFVYLHECHYDNFFFHLLWAIILGVVYIITENITYSIITHSLLNIHSEFIAIPISQKFLIDPNFLLKPLFLISMLLLITSQILLFIFVLKIFKRKEQII